MWIQRCGARLAEQKAAEAEAPRFPASPHNFSQWVVILINTSWSCLVIVIFNNHQTVVMCRSGRPRRECGSCWRGVHGNRGVAESQLIAQASRLAADRGEAWFYVVFKQ